MLGIDDCPAVDEEPVTTKLFSEELVANSEQMQAECAKPVSICKTPGSYGTESFCQCEWCFFFTK